LHSNTLLIHNKQVTYIRYYYYRTLIENSYVLTIVEWLWSPLWYFCLYYIYTITINKIINY